jgi:Acetyltransferase (GNAT) family
MDFFMIRIDGQDAGVVMGHPTDWTSYYVRSAAVLPAFRDRRVLTQFGERLFDPLRAAGVERIEAETSPANVPMGRLLTGQGYMVTGSVTSERWGVVLRYTKFLAPEAQAAFMRQYTAMPFAQRAQSKPNA